MYTKYNKRKYYIPGGDYEYIYIYIYIHQYRLYSTVSHKLTYITVNINIHIFLRDTYMSEVSSLKINI